MRRRVLTPHPGLSTGIGYYLGGMEEVRSQVQVASESDSGRSDWQTAVSRRAFDWRPGAAHRRSRVVLDADGCRGHQLTEEDKQAPYWDVLDDVDRVARNGYTTEFCLKEIEKIRNQTRDVLFSYNDKDLERMITFERDGETTEYNLRWILHRLIDHEAQHKGQILMLKRLMAI